jgi:hypothetical protein
MRVDIKLSENSIDGAIKKLQKYKRRLQGRLDKYIEALCEIGINTIDAEINAIDPETFGGEPDATAFSTKEPSPDGHCKMRIKLTGNDVLFIEFSAGITYGTDSYPLPSGKGYGMGTYPDGKGFWNNPDGWYYKDEGNPYADENGLVHSYGNPAYMPMYHAIESIRFQMWYAAWEIFWTGV